MTPSMLNLPAGCAFNTRCPRADDTCLERPGITVPEAGRNIRCFHPHVEVTV
jgi:peptide/nickel transport system ATP-binding protein